MKISFSSNLNKEFICLTNKNKLCYAMENNEICKCFIDGKETILFNIIGKNTKQIKESAKKLGDFLKNIKSTKVYIDIDHIDIIDLAFYLSLEFYVHGMYKTNTKKANKLQEIVFVVDNTDRIELLFQEKKILSESITLMKDLANEPANILYPESFVDRIKTLLIPLGINVKIFDTNELKEKGFEGVIAVGKGSIHPPYVVVMEWFGDSNKNNNPIALVGKGITFDTGGISLKPSNNMEDMKADMSGAALVVSSMMNIARNNRAINVVGIVALAENMPSGSATNPGDVIKSLSGQTIEILNTDAEGRIVLADILWYINNTYSLKFIIDFATLTGAIKVALGNSCAGLFCDYELLSNLILDASNRSYEMVWQLPMINEYEKALDSTIADVKNITGGVVGAGSITAAIFLRKFVKDTPWAHIDIASVMGSAASGSSGFGMILIDELIKNTIAQSK